MTGENQPAKERASDKQELRASQEEGGEGHKPMLQVRGWARRRPARIKARSKSKKKAREGER